MLAQRILAALIATCMLPCWAASQTGIALIVTTAAREGNTPVGYSTVTVTAIGRPDSVGRFTDDVGQTMFAPLAPGQYRVRARELGFVPVDTLVTLPDTATRVVVFLRMHQIPRQLTTVAVHAQGACRQPGIVDTAIAAQIRENADRVRLLTVAYPFYYQREERFSNGRDTYRIDTATYDSRRQPGYHVGHLVRVTRDPEGNRAYVFVLPNLQDLADSGFQRVHCFWYAGNDSGAIRIDVEPLVTLGDADVAARFYLDPERYLVRRATFRVTHPERINPQLESQVVETRYRELAPLVAVPDSMVSTSQIRQSWRTSRQTIIEQSRMVGVWDAAGLAADSSSVQVVDAAANDTGVRDVHGRLLAADSAPLTNAHVEILSLRLGATTDDHGDFDMHGVPASEQTLFIRRVGNRPTTATLPAHTRQITIHLPASSVVTLDPVKIQAAGYAQIGFDERRRTQRGFFLDATQIARMRPVRIHELLARAPGFRYVRGGPVRDDGMGPYIPADSITPEGDLNCTGTGCTPCLSYYADGHLLIDGSGTHPSLTFRDIEHDYPPDQVAAIEMYSSATAPPGVTTGAEECAVVVIWTKRYLASLKPSG